MQRGRSGEIDRDHAAACATAQQPSESTGTYDLIALGPDVVCTGEILGMDESAWTLHLKDLIRGDFNDLVGFIDRFPSFASRDQHVLVNEIGDGRVLAKAPTLIKCEIGYRVQCQVAASFPRISAKELGSQPAISPATNGPYVQNGQLARVSGLASLPQRVQSCLSLQRGEWFLDRTAGVRFAEYFGAFRDSPWLEQLLMLEIVRQAAIPCYKDDLNRIYTPLGCVERVLSVQLLADAPNNERLPLRVGFDVKGVGRWQCDLSVCLPSSFVKARLDKTLAHSQEQMLGRGLAPDALAGESNSEPRSPRTVATTRTGRRGPDRSRIESASSWNTNLRLARANAKLSRAAASNRLKKQGVRLGPEAIKKHEEGKAQPKPEARSGYAKIYGVPESTLFPMPTTT